MCHLYVFALVRNHVREATCLQNESADAQAYLCSGVYLYSATLTPATGRGAEVLHNPPARSRLQKYLSLAEHLPRRLKAWLVTSYVTTLETLEVAGKPFESICQRTKVLEYPLSRRSVKHPVQARNRRFEFGYTSAGKGGKNRRRGKNESEEKRELIFKEDGQGRNLDLCWQKPGRSVGSGRQLTPQNFCCRICPGSTHARQWQTRSHVYRWHQAPLSHSRKDAKESLGQFREFPAAGSDELNGCWIHDDGCLTG